MNQPSVLNHQDGLMAPITDLEKPMVGFQPWKPTQRAVVFVSSLHIGKKAWAKGTAPTQVGISDENYSSWQCWQKESSFFSKKSGARVSWQIFPSQKNWASLPIHWRSNLFSSPKNAASPSNWTSEGQHRSVETHDAFFAFEPRKKGPWLVGFL